MNKFLRKAGFMILDFVMVPFWNIDCTAIPQKRMEAIYKLANLVPEPNNFAFHSSDEEYSDDYEDMVEKKEVKVAKKSVVGKSMLR